MQSECKPVMPLRKFGGASVPPVRHYVPFFESLMWLTQQQPRNLGLFSVTVFLFHFASVRGRDRCHFAAIPPLEVCFSDCARDAIVCRH